MKAINIINLIIIFCIVIVCLLGCDDNKEHSKDDQLIQNFQLHKNEFNQLLLMFQQDKSLGRVADDFTRPANFFEKCEGQNAWNGKEIEVNTERLEQYQKLFVSLNLPKGIEGYCEKNTIWFYASSKGLSVSGSTKGYAYLQKAPEDSSKIVDNLDKYWSKDRKSFTAFRHIEGNWYLFLDYED